jgi:hypothetical protein
MTGRPACGRFNYCRYHAARHKNNQFVDLADLVITTVLVAPGGAFARRPRCWSQNLQIENRRGRKIVDSDARGQPESTMCVRMNRGHDGQIQPTDGFGCRQLSTTLFAVPRA